MKIIYNEFMMCYYDKSLGTQHHHTMLLFIVFSD
jgi:hypothetical protein